MKYILRTVKWLILLLLLVLVFLYLNGLWKLRNQEPDPEWLNINTQLIQTEPGFQVASRYGCTSCHGEDLSGDKAWPVPSLIAHVEPPSLQNIGLTDEQWVKAVRLGLGSDNKPLLFMPSSAFTQMSDQELWSIIEWSRKFKQDPQVNNTKLGWAGPIMVGAGIIELSNEKVNQEHILQQVLPTANANYGASLAKTCQQCHGGDLSGKPITNHGPPSGPDIRGHSVLNKANGWDEAAFTKFFANGIRPNGLEVSEQMPWQALGQGYQEVQLKALWLYLSKL